MDDSELEKEMEKEVKNKGNILILMYSIKQWIEVFSLA